MGSARLQLIEEIFHAARELNPDRRSAFLRTNCGGDEELRNEVEALLDSHEAARDFITAPPIRLAADLLEHPPTESMVGLRIGHYELLEKIGSGGMGEVYLARDDRSHRKAAVKILPALFARDETRFRRFEQEARAVVALNHPNILTVYEIGNEDGTQYIASELIEGETLRGRLGRETMSLEEIVDLAIQVASALAASHEAGIVHRDIKPENIMLRPDGYVKVLDFGVAKLAEQELPAVLPKDEALLLTQTTFSSILGTLRYMSPEQARGEAVDTRTDIWSLGVVLYEMVTGSNPFASTQAREVIASVLTTDPPPLRNLPPEVSTELQQVVGYALQKDRSDRYSTIREMHEALREIRRKLDFVRELAATGENRIISGRVRRLPLLVGAAFIALASISVFFLGRQRGPTTPAASPEIPSKSIAVLPFQNLSADRQNDYFASGIQDEILARLATIADLKVTSRTSTQRYKSSPENLPEIARQLGVAHILEGSVQKNGETVRVSVQLIKAANDSHLWGNTFDRKLTDIFSVESEVARSIAEQLRARLSGQEEQTIVAKPTDNGAAYDAYLRGLAYFQKPSFIPAVALGGQKYLREAVRLDPKFALAWALLSQIDARGYISRSLQPTAALREEVRQAADTALALQPQLGEAVLAKGNYYYACLKDYDKAERSYELARPLLPNSSRISELLAFVARRRGQWERSNAYFEQAERLDPRNVALLTEHAISYNVRRRFPEALQKLDQVLDIVPDDMETLALKAAVAQGAGDLTGASALLGPLHPEAKDTNVLQTQVYQAILERRTGPIIARLKAALSQPDPAVGHKNTQTRFWLGWAEQVAGYHSAAKEDWRQTRAELESLLKEQPEDYLLIGYLALTNMGLDDKTAAFKLAEREMTLLPPEKDAFAGPDAIEIEARVSAQAGETDRALALIEKLLAIPYGGPLTAGSLTPALLQLDPMFDSLRNNPRFQKLASSSKSVAVLPFENLSADPQNDYFASGIQDEILTKLVGVDGLKVISRASTTKYRSRPDNIKEVASELGASCLLEGSVQRAGETAHISIQLFDGLTGDCSWARTYDREIRNIFSVESEVAEQVASSLKLRLSPSMAADLQTPPTNDPEAYDLYLRASYAHSQWFRGAGDPEEAIRLMHAAVARDPTFAKAFARLSIFETQKFAQGLGMTPDLAKDARSNATKAMTLAPELPDSITAQGLICLRLDRDNPKALAYFQKAQAKEPGSDNTLIVLSIAHAKLGHLDKSIEEMRRAVELNPRSAHALEVLASYYGKTRQYGQALNALDRALELDPNGWAGVSVKAECLLAQGRVAETRDLLEKMPRQLGRTRNARYAAGMLWECAYFVHDLPGALVAATAMADSPTDSVEAGEKELLMARTELALGEHDKAKPLLDQSRRKVKAVLAIQPEIPELYERLAQIETASRNKSEAMAAAEKAIELAPLNQDADGGLSALEIRAEVDSQFGKIAESTGSIRRILATDGSGLLLTPALLRLNPVWDPLRSDPDFQKMCQ